jgi:hypothetical protein
MPEGQHLSVYLLEMAAELTAPSDDLPQNERAEIEDLAAEIISWTKRGRFAVLKSDEQDHWARHLVNNGYVSNRINEALTLEALRRVPARVRRLLKLSELWTETPLDRESAMLLDEAVRAYVEGLPGAAVALARAALERRLKVSLGTPMSAGGLDTLITKVRLAGALDSHGEAAARTVQRLGNAFLHQGDPSSDDAEVAIMQLREVVRQLGRGGFGEQSHA